MGWKFGVTDIVNVSGFEYEVTAKVISDGNKPDYYEVICLQDYTKTRSIRKDHLEIYALSTMATSVHKFDIGDLFELRGSTHRVYHRAVTDLKHLIYVLYDLSNGLHFVATEEELIQDYVRRSPVCDHSLDHLIMKSTITTEGKCQHTKTKLNHAGGVVFKQCCDCKEDLGDA
jgi:hypothetical protein